MPFNADRILAVKLVADVSSISKDVKQAERGIKRASTKLKGFARGAASWGKAFAGAAVITGLESVAGMFGDAIEGAREGERQFAQLQNTATQLGIPIEKLAKGFDAVSEAATAVGQSDTAVQRMFTALVTKGDPAWKAQRKVNAALDVAAKLGIPVETAGKLIESAMQGNARAARKLGVDGRKGTDALRGIEERFAGAAEAAADADPFAVAMERIGEAFETIAGVAILPVLAAVGGLMKNVVAPAVEDVANKLAEVDWDTLDWGKALTDALAGALQSVATAVSTGEVDEVAALGGAIAAVVFGIGIFTKAASVMFGLPGWATRVAVGAAAKAVGVAFAAGMFLVNVFISAAGTMFDKVGGSMALKRRVAGAGRSLGTSMGTGFNATFLGRLGLLGLGLTTAVAGITMLGEMVPEAQRVPTSLRASAQQAFLRSGGRVTRDVLAASLRRSFPQATDAEIQDALAYVFRRRGARFGRGTGGASRGWHLVGEGGAELVRFRGGEQVLNSRATADAMGGGQTVNVSIQAGIGDSIAIGREVDRVLRQYRRRAGLAYS